MSRVIIIVHNDDSASSKKIKFYAEEKRLMCIMNAFSKALHQNKYEILNTHLTVITLY